MIWVYGIILLALVVLIVINSGYKKKLFKNLDRHEHPLRLLYPLSARLADLCRHIFPDSGRADRIRGLLRSLYVRENVEYEEYLYIVRKYASIVAVITGISLLGFLTCAANSGITYIKYLNRPGYGESSKSYELDVDYKNTQDKININVSAVKYTESEILELFEKSLDGVKQEMLGENESQDCVTQPLNLIDEYNGFNIYWEIEDISEINYNGEIQADLEEGMTSLVNLYATFSLDDISQIFTIPVMLSAKTLDGQEKLINSITEQVESENNIYSDKVTLPEQVNGYNVKFSETKEDDSYLLLLLGIFALIAIAVFYDKALEDKVKKRNDQMMLDFTEIVSKLSLLYEAGLSIHSAFERIVSDQEAKEEKYRSRHKKDNKDTRYAYTEMKLALEKIDSGVSESEAYAQFGKRCALYPYIKLGNILEQNLNKGTKGMKLLLKQEVQESFETRKRLARKKGEQASTKMLIPMVLMLIVVIAIIAIPALMSMDV